ncbi:hypothetical protein MHSWG343_10740 [Candidatus Mycoplasma haematohominis]|uniref:Uncharacterized protein n=1 Tax=Candidatus Mycoplasma haematohominis TaxID=1494318 RepID=A0A478FUQ0_9MOLU|nr:hypothetical protein MHSWG343_10740 [Candidatus Mycoplasma haemohominis]
MYSSKTLATVIAGSAVFIWISFGIYVIQSRKVSVSRNPRVRHRYQSGRRFSGRKFIKNPQAGTFGFDFQKHFIDTSDKANVSWWSWSYKRFSSSREDAFNSRRISFEFQSIKSVDDLKERCSEAYKKKTREEISPINRNIKQEKYESDIWTYCSVEGGTPETIYEQGDRFIGRYKLGNVYQSSMISTRAVENGKFWRRQAIAFYGENGKGIGSEAKDEQAGFKKLYETDDRTIESLKELCEINYDISYSENSELAKETLRFCSLSGSINR